MRLKYDFVEDHLERKEIAKHYVQFINKLQGNHTIALDAPWGSGKSTFIDFICENMDKDENKDIYIKYNAWDNDYTDEPFLSLMSEIFSSFEEKKYIGKDELKNVKSKAIAISKAFGKGITKGLVKNILGSDATKDLSDGIESLAKGAISETSQLLIDSTFKNMSQTKKTREQFTEELKSTTSKIIEEKSKDKLIIIIDELDRCKPTFAIELLENIKHLFAIDEIIFFIAVDRTQLAESIKAVYGLGFDANTYLDRFFDVQLHLEKSNLNNHFKVILNNYFERNTNNTHSEKAIKLYDITLRDFERIVSETFLLRTMNENTYFQVSNCIFLLIIKYKDQKIYEALKKNRHQNIETIHHASIQINTSREFNTFFHESIIEIISGPRNQRPLSELRTNHLTYELIEIIDNTL